MEPTMWRVWLHPFRKSCEEKIFYSFHIQTFEITACQIWPTVSSTTCIWLPIWNVCVCLSLFLENNFRAEQVPNLTLPPTKHCLRWGGLGNLDLEDWSTWEVKAAFTQTFPGSWHFLATLGTECEVSASFLLFCSVRGLCKGVRHLASVSFHGNQDTINHWLLSVIDTFSNTEIFSCQDREFFTNTVLISLIQTPS